MKKNNPYVGEQKLDSKQKSKSTSKKSRAKTISRKNFHIGQYLSSKCQDPWTKKQITPGEIRSIELRVNKVLTQCQIMKWMRGLAI